MALSCKVGSFNLSTAAAGNTQAITGVGFQPKAIIFWWNGRTDTLEGTSNTVHKNGGFGFAVSSTDRRCIGSNSQDNTAAADSQRGMRDDACIMTLTAAQAVEGLMDLQSMDSDGFTLIIDDDFPSTYQVQYLALGGSDITNQAGGSFTSPTATGNQDITSVGFQPDCVFFLNIASTTSPPVATASSNAALGVAAGSSISTACWNGTSTNAADPMTTWNYCKSGESNTVLISSSITDRGSVSAWLSNGFTINWAEVNGGSLAYNFQYLALKGGNYIVGDFLTATSTSAGTISESGFGFQPRGALFVSHCNTQSTADTRQTQDALSIGAWEAASSNNFCAGWADEDAAMTTDITTSVQQAECYVNTDLAGAVEGLAIIDSADSGGFTGHMTDADPSQNFVWYLAFGDAAGGGGTSVKDMIMCNGFIPFAR